jgi:hypothetical protein
VRSVSLLRWGNARQEHFSYIPFGGEIHVERRFGDLILPSEVSVGWWWGTPRYEPFFEVCGWPVTWEPGATARPNRAARGML